MWAVSVCDEKLYFCTNALTTLTCSVVTPDCLVATTAGGGGVLPEKLGVRPASQNPYPIYDQDLRYSLPYLWPDQKFESLFKTLPLNPNPVQTNVKLS